MSDLFRRWSERKRRARLTPPEPADASLEPVPTAAPQVAPNAPSTPAPAGPVADGPVPDGPVADEAAALAEKLAALPPLDQITASTDIRGYLADFVPQALKNAALRRAWVSDPIISNHLDVARDYAWDFNSGALPVGFSASLNPEIIARELDALKMSPLETAPPTEAGEAADLCGDRPPGAITVSNPTVAPEEAEIKNTREPCDEPHPQTYEGERRTANGYDLTPEKPTKILAIPKKNGGALPR